MSLEGDISKRIRLQRCHESTDDSQKKQRDVHINPCRRKRTSLAGDQRRASNQHTNTLSRQRPRVELAVASCAILSGREFRQPRVLRHRLTELTMLLQSVFPHYQGNSGEWFQF